MKHKLVILFTISIFVAMGLFVVNYSYKPNSRNAKEIPSNEYGGTSLCGDYMFDSHFAKIDDEIFYLMESRKYEEVISLGNKYLEEDGTDQMWYCDPYFWTQRAKAFLNLGNCYQAIVAATHNAVIYPRVDNLEEKADNFLTSIIDSDICTSKNS